VLHGLPLDKTQDVTGIERNTEYHSLVLCIHSDKLDILEARMNIVAQLTGITGDI